jgi:hypothetical protein
MGFVAQPPMDAVARSRGDAVASGRISSFGSFAMIVTGSDSLVAVDQVPL